MRIAFLTYEYPPDTGKGGIGTYTAQAASLLSIAGNEVHVFAGSHIREENEQLEGIFVYRVLCDSPFDFRLKVVSAFSSVHNEFPFDVIESAEIHANALEVKKAFPSIPLVVRLHAPNYIVESLKKRYVPFLDKFRYLLGALRRGYWDAGYWRTYKYQSDPDFQFTKMADAVTAPSQAMKDWAVQYWKIHPEKIKVIGNPFEPSEALLQIPIVKTFEHKTIIFFGRLNVLKGLVNATKAIQNILVAYPDWKFKVIGDDGPGPIPGGVSMRTWMKQRLSQFGERVEFYNGASYEILPILLQEGEIVVLPSLFESFSYTCIEAMAAGKAVVGSSTGGMKELIEHGKTGLLVHPENVRQLYSAISYFIENQNEAIAFAQSARSQVIGQNRNFEFSAATLDIMRSISSNVRN